MLMKIQVFCYVMVLCRHAPRIFRWGRELTLRLYVTYVLKLCYQNHVINISICSVTLSLCLNHMA